MYEDYAFIRTAREGGILTVTMDNPPMNAASLGLHQELARIFGDINRDEDARVVIFTGAGKVFSAGGNLREMQEKRHDAQWHMRFMADAGRIVTSLIDLEKPIIARVNGHAMGLGATLALLCDFIIASTEARIADPHVKVGLVAGDGGALVWPMAIGMPRAKEALLLGEPLTAARAEAIGLINYAVEPALLDEKVGEIAQKLAAGPRKAIAYTKKAMNMVLRERATAMIEAHLKLEIETIFDPDHHEAVDAFNERRAPRFAG